MKIFNLIAFLSFFVSSNAFAQTPKEVEADIYQSFQKINYWNGYRYEHSSDTGRFVNALDSMGKANKAFGGKLKYYTEKFPFTLSLKFKSFADESLGIFTSADGLFRIYSWDTRLGGTMRHFESVMQYQSGKGTKSILMPDTSSNGDSKYLDSFTDVYTLKIGNKNYYLARYFDVFSRRSRNEGIRVFSIDNGVLNGDARIIKTASGMRGTLECPYDLISIPAGKRDKVLSYDPISKKIHFPVVTDKGKVTQKKITYKFNGKYFEMVKN